MKWKIFCFLFFLMNINCYAINGKYIPAQVKNTVHSLYPHKEFKWTMYSDGYGAKSKGKKFVLLFLNDKGVLLEKEEEILIIDVPSIIRDSLKGHDIYHVIKYHNYEKNSIVFEISSRYGKYHYDVFYNSNGQVQEFYKTNERSTKRVGFFIMIVSFYLFFSTI